MSFLFKQKARADAAALHQYLLKLDSGNKKKDIIEVSKYLSMIRAAISGEGLDNLSKLEFESKKDVVQIFNCLLWRQIGTRYPTVEYIYSHSEVLVALIKGYEDQRIALNCGMMLRECVMHASLTKCLLYSESFWKFFTYAELQAFDVASDAFATFKDLLTKHKQLVSAFLQEKYDEFFNRYSKLLYSQNYVTKRQSLKLLGELLLDRGNFNIMIKYISDANNLKLVMNLLKDNSRNIQFEAFHVFKVFVVNPNKTKPVMYILEKNKTKLISFLETFHEDRTDDGHFSDEKLFLIKQLNEI